MTDELKTIVKMENQFHYRLGQNGVQLYYGSIVSSSVKQTSLRPSISFATDKRKHSFSLYVING